jgi:hypothetical protein
MIEITNAGYQEIRNYIQSSWNYVELRDADVAIMRIPTSDPRCEWLHSVGDQVLKLQITLAGSDADISLPATMSGVALYNTSTGGEALTIGAFTAVTLEELEDQLKIIVQVEVPEVI